MKKWWLLSLIILCIAGMGFILFGIQSGPKPMTPALFGKPARIVSLAPNLTEILFELGLDKEITAVSSDSDCPDTVMNKTKVGTFWQPDTEAIIACKPDLVVTLWFEQQQSVADTLSRLSYHVLTLRLEKIDELWTAILKIGTATDCRQQADELVRNIKNKLSRLKSMTTDTNKTRVLWVIQSEPLRVAGRNTFINELIELAGGENAIGQTIQQYPPISTEELLACGAEVIVQSAMDMVNLDQQQQTAQLFWNKCPNLPAVKNNRIYVVNSDTMLRLGPRLPHGVEIIARFLHPEIFKEQDVNL
jgi:iron complex transport system substrate-binding protein